MTATQTPIQPVPSPILCNPYEEPRDHWLYDRDTGTAKRAGFRRDAAYWYKTEKVGSAQAGLFADEEQDPLELVNRLREDVRRWRESGYRGATSVTKDLLRHWARKSGTAKGGFQRLFYCQRESVETIIYLAEIRLPEMDRKAKSRTGFTNFQVSNEHLRKLCAGEDPGFGTQHVDYYPTLLDQPADDALLGLRRLGCKQATGTGKTVVMAMLICWAFCNRGVNPQSREFPDVVLVCCPNLTVKERLQVLHPGDPKNYYDDFGLLPTKYRELLNRGTVIVENWHQFQPQSAHSEGGSSYAVVDKGEEDAESFVRRILGDTAAARMPIMVFNDEGHHCWRPKPGDPVETGLDDEERVALATGDEKEEVAEARVWLDGLDRINNSGLLGEGVPCVGLCVDLSATPFYIRASGYPDGSPFPWLVCEFGLVDAIESGVVKIPRLPVLDTTGRPDPKYFRLWRDHICADLEPGEKLPGRGGGRPKPEVVYRKAQGALTQIAGQWKERFEYIRDAAPGKEQIPPVLIIVCDNTSIAEELYRRISGEQVVDTVTHEDVEKVLGKDDEEAQPARKKGKKPKTQVVHGRGEVFPDLLSNTPERQYTLRIDSKLLAEAESDDPNKKKSDEAERLRKIVATVGRRGEPGEHIRCIVSVSMLTEGWDAKNVTHILGIRAFGSQLLCEQVVGRGLRRMDYEPDPESGLLTEEFVDVYGIPFSMIPFKGRGSKASAPEDKPKNHVRAEPDRAHMQMQFPVVEGFVYALKRNIIRCDIDEMEPLELEPEQEPTATFVRVTAGFAEGAASAVASPFEIIEQNREAYYTENHVETIKFELSRRLLDRLLSGAERGEKDRRKASVLALQSRHQLFPQVFRYVDEYISRKVDYRGCPASEIGLQKYAKQVVERLATAIEPDAEQGEPPLLPVLNKTKPIGSTDDVDFKTVKPTRMTTSSHVNQVVLDNRTWEASAAFRLEQLVQRGTAKYYVKNQGLGLTIPYEYLGVDHSYVPDFLVKLANEETLVLEIKGWEDNQDKAKHESARRWVRAVNNWGRLGQWRFHVNKDPQLLGNELRALLDD